MATGASKNQKVLVGKLHIWNVRLAVIYAVFALLVLLLGATRLFPVQISYLTIDPIASELSGHSVLTQATHHVFDINLAQLVAVFLVTSAVVHVLVATIGRKAYEADLRAGVNRARWIEYALSASTMMIAIAVISGVTDLSTLILVFAATAIAGLLGLAMEAYNRGRSTPHWLAYILGAVLCSVSWIVIGLYLWGSSVFGSGAPSFAYWIYGSLLVVFGGLAISTYLQQRKQGRWSDYAYGERAFMLLSLVAKTVLAWQIFMGALRA